LGCSLGPFPSLGSFFFSSRSRHTSSLRDWSSDVCSSALVRAIREQVSSALDAVIHLERLEDGSRRVTSVSEVQRMESDVITMQRSEERRVGKEGGAGGTRQH